MERSCDRALASENGRSAAIANAVKESSSPLLLKSVVVTELAVGYPMAYLRC